MQWQGIESLPLRVLVRFHRCASICIFGLGIGDQLIRFVLTGRTMYVIPFSMGPVGGAISKNGVQLTDSKYVVASMRIMTRITPKVFDLISNESFVKCLHSVGCPLPLERKLLCHQSVVARLGFFTWLHFLVAKAEILNTNKQCRFERER